MELAVASTAAAMPVEQDAVLRGRRAAMVSFSRYPGDPRPRRAAEALAHEGMAVEMIAVGGGGIEPSRENVRGIDVLRLPLEHQRRGKVDYLARYAAFIAAAFGVLAVRSLRRRYDLVYVNNMPDVLVLSALVPKMRGAKVILDLHDPMPELMTTIFGADPRGRAVRALTLAERYSVAFADQVLTVNQACRTLFASRSCGAEKIAVVMNAPDETIFGFRAPDLDAGAADRAGRRFVLMYHGSLVERYGLHDAVEALALLRHSIPEAELRIYGRPAPFVDGVLDAARARGVGDAVQFLGPRSLEQIVEAIDGCDLGLVPNQRTRFTELATPTRIFEYLARGKPVIAARSRATLDYFDEDALLFFEPGNADDLAGKIADVFRHPRETHDVVLRGQAVYRTHTWRQECARLVDVVARLLRS